MQRTAARESLVAAEVCRAIIIVVFTETRKMIAERIYIYIYCYVGSTLLLTTKKMGNELGYQERYKKDVYPSPPAACRCASQGIEVAILRTSF